MSKYTEEQYRRAKDVVETLPKAQADVVWQRIQEYEAEHAQATPDDLESRLTEPPLTAPQENWDTPPAHQLPEKYDMDLPNASKLKKYAAPPEYVSKSQSALGIIAKSMLKDPLDGPAVTMHFEPSEQQFEADMGPYLQAKGVQPGSKEYGEAFAQYKDAKWEQAYAAAAAEDRPLTRAEYLPENAGGWNKLTTWLGDKADVGSAFLKGVASGGTLGLTRGLETDADREQRARRPVANLLGELKGAINPRSLASKLTGGVGRAGTAVGLGRYGASALAGGAAGVADVGGHALGDELSDKLHGRPIDRESRSNLTGRLLGGALLGAGAGVLGEGAATLAQRYRSGIRSATSDIGPELTNAEASGTATDVLRGLEPSSDVKAILERARGPVPGEAKLSPSGSAVEYAAGAVRGPIVAQQVDEHAAALQRMEEESMRLYGSDPTLKAPKKMSELVKALRYHLVERSQPEAAGKFLPAPDDALGARNNSPLLDFARRAIKPRLVLSVDAAKEAARGGGELVSLADAKRMGFNVKGLGNEINPETGIPHNAPSLSGYSKVADDELVPDQALRDMPTRVDDDMLQPPAEQPVAPIGPVPANDVHGVSLGARGQNDIRHSPTMRRILAGGGPPANSFAQIDPALRKQILAAGLEPANSFTIPDIIVPENYPADEFQVLLEPRAYDALKMEAQIKAIDQAGKAGTEARVDPIWPDLMRAARVDREQFGKAWSGLKNVHHEELTGLEQRAAHAGITERNPYPEMSGNAQKTANAAITNYGVAPQATNEALAELADNAGVRQGLETLKGTRAYSALKEKASPQAGMTEGGGFLRVGGLLPAVKLRLDALARGVTRGPEGNPLFGGQLNPALVNEPLGRELLPSSGLLAMGRGALGVKTGSVYDSATGRAKPAGTLTPQEREQLERMLAP